MTNIATVSHKDFFNAPAVKARIEVEVEEL